jgi:hypothetical protein
MADCDYTRSDLCVRHCVQVHASPTVRAIAAAKRDLAEKVLDAIARVSPTKEYGTMRDPFAVKASIELAARSLFTAEGIELTTTQQQEGE